MKNPEAVFSTLYSQLDPRIQRMARAMARTDRDFSLDYEDFIQEARMAVWSALVGGCAEERTGEVLMAYLLATARNALRDIYKAHARKNRTHASTEWDSVGDVLESPEGARELLTRLTIYETAALLHGFEAEILALILNPDKDTLAIAARPSAPDSTGRIHAAVRITTGVLAERLGRPQRAVQNAVARIRVALEEGNVWAS